MSIIKDIVTSDFFVLVVIPAAIVVGVLYVCKKYGFSIIPKSLRRGKKKKFKMPSIDRKEVDHALGRGKYVWVAEENTRENNDNMNADVSNESVNNTIEKDVPFYISEARVVPKPMRKNIYD